jgi:hypothetical protein
MVDYVGNNNPDGVSFGLTTSELISFYGKTPVAQLTHADQSAVATTALTTITDIVTTASLTGAFNSVVSRVSALIVLVNRMRADLVTIGILKGS